MIVELTDDGRRWWVCGATVWNSFFVVEAPSKRAALAKYRRIIAEGERANGTTWREIREVLAHAGLTAHDEPLSTPHAFLLDLAQFLGEEATRWSSGREVIVPAIGNRAAIEEAVALLTAELGAEKASRMRAQVLARYVSETATGSNPGGAS